MEQKKIEELSFLELKQLCREKGLEVEKKDTKEILIAKLKDYSSKMVNRERVLTSMVDKMKHTKQVIVTKNDPEDTRDSFMATITNATGTWEFPVIFNTKIEMPVPFIKNLQNAKVQKFRKVRTNLGTFDEAYITNRYLVQIIGE